MKKLFLEKTLFFVVSIGIVVLLFLGGTYYFFLNIYERLETSHNIKHARLLVQNINSELLRLRQDNFDHAYFITSDNYSSRRLNLDNLDFDFFFKTDDNNNILFDETKTNFEFRSSKNRLFKQLVTRFEKSYRISAIYIYEGVIVALSKEKAAVENEKGYFYIGKILSNQYLQTKAPFFETLSTVTKPLIKEPSKLKFSSLYFSNIYLNTQTSHNDFVNYIQFFAKDNRFLFALKTKHKRDIVATGEQTLLIFLAIVIFFLLLVFFLTNKYVKAIRNNNEVLEQEVDKRTHQIQSALDELEKVNLKLYDIAHTDFLTKTRNRRNFFIHSENAFNKSQKENSELSVIMIDIDNFKPFNDQYGHAVGDQVLIMFSECVKKLTADSDIFGRLGGEEFAITLCDTNLEDAIDKAEKIRQEVEKLELITSSKKLTITASFGVSDKSKCTNLDQVLQKADKLLYSAKNSGKNRVRSRLNNP